MSEVVAPGKPVLSREERVALGKEARTRAPRSSHGAWAPAADRRDPVAVFEEEAADRVPGLVPIRYGRMLASPFSFFRGSASLMAGDLAGTPDSGIQAQLCGDAHLSNFGLFGSPERQLMFDINDFDETLPGPWEWDVKRLAASFEVLGRELGFSKADRRRDRAGSASASTAAGCCARPRMSSSARPGTSTSRSTGCSRAVRGTRRQASRRSGRRRRRSAGSSKAVRAGHHVRVLAKRTDTVDGELRIVGRPADDRPDRGVRPARLRVGADERGDHAAASLLPADAAARPPPSDRGVPGRPCRPEGRRRRQRRHALLHPAAARPRRATIRSSCR